MRRTFGSTCHGAGRALSRHAARKVKSGPEVRRELEAAGIVVKAASVGLLAEEAPYAYKDVADVVDVVHDVGLSRKVARLKPSGRAEGLRRGGASRLRRSRPSQTFRPAPAW